MWLRILFSKGIGPVTFWNLFRASHGSLQAAMARVPDLCGAERAEKEIFLHEKNGFQLIAACEPDFPIGLRCLRDCPPVISVLGNTALLRREAVAIVGARNASVVGRVFAHKMASNLADAGWLTVSGMARGIDAAVHEGSVESGTIAVLAGGLDVIYPPENVSLYKSISQTGVLISEQPLGTAIDPSLFPRRNRLIAGLAKAVIVIEAAAQSGSLITAHYALEQGKEVFAVPGFPSDPRSAGCNALLKEGAALVESAADVLASIGSMGTSINHEAELRSIEDDRAEPSDDGAEEAQKEASYTNEEDGEALKCMLLGELTTVPISVELLFQTHNCSLPHLLSTLSELETDGKILRHPNSDVSLAE